MNRKFLFIDGNNLGIRASFANKELSVDMFDYSEDFNPDDTVGDKHVMPTGALHGFMTTIAALRRRFPGRYFAVVWDAGCESRITLSKDAASRGIIPREYKASRRVGNPPQAVIDFVKQKPILQKIISSTNIPQVVKPREEADDVIASYVRKYQGDDILILTNDNDYYQLLGDGVMIVRGDGIVSEDDFRKKHGISPKQWIDVGALAGDDSDDIFGIPGWGETSAVKEIAAHGTCESVIAEIHAKHDILRTQYPDLKGEDLKEISEIMCGSGSKARKKYPCLQEWMPFTGVALAYERKKAKIPWLHLNALIYESRVPLAKQLKAMRDGLVLPDLQELDRNGMAAFMALCAQYKLASVSEQAGVIFGKGDEESPLFA